MDTDRELLELAAKAAGMELEECTCKRELRIKGAFRTTHWNPLADDGDALRLAAKLRIRLLWWEAFSETRAKADARMPHEAGDRQFIEFHDCDPMPATRRAIVRAAAEIGRTL